MSQPYNKKLVSTAQKLRKNMTSEEKHLWYDFLKRLPLTVNRQKNIGNYIVDFFIASHRLIIEIDGRQHRIPEHCAADQLRDNDLRKRGYTIVRYANEDINKRFCTVCKDILKHMHMEVKDIMPDTVQKGAELWDLYDATRTPLGKTHPRGRQYPMPSGTYHPVVYIFTTAADGRLLLTRRAATKRAFPGFLEITGGSALAGEDSLAAARRELGEETGLTPPAEVFALLTTLRIPEAFVDVYHVSLAADAADIAITLQDGETDGYEWVTFYELERCIQHGEFPPTGAMAYGAVREQLMGMLSEALWLCPTDTTAPADKKEAT